MELVITHGYFLKGTGSNLFVENLCRELCRMGHRVHLFCQEESPENFDFIEEAFELNADNTEKKSFHLKETSYLGKCIFYKPNLNGFLPVFVYDDYPGYKVKTFVDCEEEEIESYIQHNVKALNTGIKNKKVEMVLSNHTVMQPVYVERSQLGREDCFHVMVVHGSCLNFAVRKSSLIKKYALEALTKIQRVTFVSHYSQNEFLEFFNFKDEIREKSHVIFGGVDLEKFVALKDDNEKITVIQKLKEDLKRVEGEGLSETKEVLWKTDPDVVEKLEGIDFESEKIVLYYGKYLWTKGVQLLIGGIPLILRKHENIRFILVGFGSSRKYFEDLIEVLDLGNQEKYLEMMRHPEKFDFEIDPESSHFFKGLIDQLNDKAFAEKYFSSAKGKIKKVIIFTGFLDHDQLKNLIASSEITVAPSIFPEAFGLVAVEALSSGIIPIQTNHSGFKEVLEIYVKEFSDIFNKEKLLPLYLDENLVMSLEHNISIFLEYYNRISQEERQKIRIRARSISVKYFSWEATANAYIALKTKGV